MPNDMKDRLRELIDTARRKYWVNMLDETHLSVFMANHLIANGVIVPPVMVGDTVYMITPNGNIRNLTISDIDIELEKKEVKITCLAVYEFEGTPCYLQIQSFKFDKTVFLTREEAEAKLKEREENA